ncbi:MAG: flagellar FliJ family protein [Pseudomonadota bacterium]
MADLKSLIRLRKYRVDEKQKALADLYRRTEEFEAQKNDLIETLEKEREIAETTEDVEAGAFFGLYAEGVKAKISGIDKEINKLETRIQIAQDDIRQAFAELKQIEIVQKNREDKEAKELAAKETTEMDDIGIDGFRRQEEV